MVTHDSDLAKKVTRTIIIADGEIIEEYLTRLFPVLSQSQLIWTTSRLVSTRFMAGSSIINQYDPAENFYFVTKGEAIVTVKDKAGEEHPIAHVRRGEFFGGIGLIHGIPNLTSVRAADHCDVEVSYLDRANFTLFLEMSPQTRQTIEKTIDERYKSLSAITGETR